MADPGEAPERGGLLVAKVGKGSYVYTGLAFFRQSPKRVPGTVLAYGALMVGILALLARLLCVVFLPLF